MNQIWNCIGFVFWLLVVWLGCGVVFFTPLVIIGGIWLYATNRIVPLRSAAGKKRKPQVVKGVHYGNTKE